MSEDGIHERIRELEQRIERQEQEIEKLQGTPSDQETLTEKTAKTSDSVSRRRFLKLAAGGAAGIGTLGLASGYQIRSDNPFTLYNATQDKNFEVDTDGVLTTNYIGTEADPVNTIYTESASVSAKPSEDTDVVRKQETDALEEHVADTYLDREKLNIVDAVEAGADPTGTEDTVPILESVVDDDTLIVFPPGEYRMESTFMFTNYSNFGIIGVSQEGTRFVVPDSFEDDTLFILGTQVQHGDNLLLRNFEVDITAEETGPGIIITWVDKRAVLEDITVTGQMWKGEPALSLGTTDPDATFNVRRLYAPEGNDPAGEGGGSGHGATGIFVHSDSEGVIRIEDCTIGNFTDNGVYASSSNGRVIVEGGYYHNNNVSNVRLGDEGVVRDATIRIDEEVYLDGEANNQQGIWAYSGHVTVENCTITRTDPDTNGFDISGNSDLDALTIRGETVIRTVIDDGSSRFAVRTEDDTRALFYGLDVINSDDGSPPPRVVINGERSILQGVKTPHLVVNATAEDSVLIGCDIGTISGTFEDLVQINEGEVELSSPGEGIVLTTPDGENQYRIRVDNEGDLVTESVS